MSSGFLHLFGDPEELRLAFNGAWPGHNHQLIPTDGNVADGYLASLFFFIKTSSVFFADELVGRFYHESLFHRGKCGKVGEVCLAFIANQANYRPELPLRDIGLKAKFLNFFDHVGDFFFGCFRFHDYHLLSPQFVRLVFPVTGK